MSINRRNAQVSPRESGVVNPDTGPTAPGYNQSLREVSRILIAIVGVLLWLDHPKTALCATLGSIIMLHYGTSFSVKNWKWRFVAWGSLPECGIACFIHSSLSLVDEEKAYTIHLLMQLTLYIILYHLLPPLFVYFLTDVSCSPWHSTSQYLLHFLPSRFLSMPKFWHHLLL